MTKRLPVLFALALILGAEPSEQDDLKRMQGEWKVEKAQRGGESPPAEDLTKLSVRIDGNKMSIDDGSARDERAAITLDPSQKPATIDLKRLSDDKVLRGIYKFDGDTLTICWDREDARPTEFRSKPGSTQMLFVMKRKK